MRIIHLNSNISSGGAATSALALHHNMLSQGLKSQILNFKENEKNLKVIKIPTIFRLVSKVLEVFFSNFNKKYKKEILSYNIIPTGVGLYLQQKIKRSDTLIIHWFGRELISFNELTKLDCKKILIVHDLWFCGGASHVDINKSASILEKYHSKCKTEFLENMNHMVTPSEFMFLNMANIKGVNPVLFRNQIPAIHVNTGIKTYKKRDGVLLGSADTSEIHKGGDLILPFVFAVKNLCPGLPITIVGSMNKYSQKKFNDIGCNVTGKLRKQELHLLMSRSKICVSLSRVDNFPNMLLEAGLLGCYLCAFAIGGNPEIIFDKKVGLLSEEINIDALASIVSHAIGQEHCSTEISQHVTSLFADFGVAQFKDRFLTFDTV